jgi:nitrite reductase/ring-hydroxylating ferredoxin subunit
MRVTVLFLALLLAACAGTQLVQNPYLINASFDVQIDTRLPLYSEVQQIGVPITIPQSLGGIKGIHLVQVGIDSFRAFEVACPNHTLETCSATEAKGTSATCGCSDGFSYSLFTGQLLNRQGESVLFDLKEYAVRAEGPMLYIYN